MFRTLFPDRFQLLKSLFLFYIIFSFLIRLGLYIEAFSDIDFSFLNLLSVFSLGFMFDIGSISFILLPYVIYLTFYPKQWHGNKLDRIITKISFFILTLVLNFSFLAEITFWSEYHKRFNFISVDYLLYTYEVFENINESYSIPLIVLVIIGLTFLVYKIISNKRSFEITYNSHNNIKAKIPVFIIFSISILVYQNGINNSDAEQFENQFENELSKSGVYSFFAAYNSNELIYNDFYKTLNSENNIHKFKTILSQENINFHKTAKNPLTRTVNNTNPSITPNIMLVCIESMTSSFMGYYGNKDNQTPYLDNLMDSSINLSNLQAVGTRTIRGIEALTMCIPPTPGRSILKRENSKNLFNVGNIFEQKGYSRTFFYGGDSHFDNMVTYFGNNGYDIVDRKKEHRFEDPIQTTRTRIEDNEVTFENAWGACDEDLFEKVLKITDAQSQAKKPFFNFVMTSSNHPPFTYPEGKIIREKGSTERSGAVKYTDYAIKEFMEKAKLKPWFKNTVFVFVADHNSYSAGRTEIRVGRYHIPAFIYNLNHKPEILPQLCSQIDLLPTLFGYLGWNYDSKLMGMDVRNMTRETERAFISNHRKLALRKKMNLVILDSHKDSKFVQWSGEGNSVKKISEDKKLETEAIMYYQTAYELYKNGLMQDKIEN